MIRDQTSVPPLCFHGSVWFRVRPVGEAVDRPLRLFLPLPITQNQLILLVRGQQTKTLVKAPGVPVGLIQDLTDKKKKLKRRCDVAMVVGVYPDGGCDSSAVFQVLLLLQCLTSACSALSGWPVAYFVVVMAAAVCLRP